MPEPELSSGMFLGIIGSYNNNCVCRRQVVDPSQTDGGFEWGYALPGEPTGSNDEYIGYIVRQLDQRRQTAGR
jgi:hypothetical protein